jgi:sensor histidine kinase YesM/ligand-binding sensor domain-containing protein
MKTRFYWLLMLFTITDAFGQEPFMWHVTDNDGLPSMEVYNIIQDKKGFYWIGTDNGLCKYDGRTFKQYYHPKQRGKSFSRFKLDSKGRVWMVNFAGQIFYVENDSLQLFEPYEKYFKQGFPRFDLDQHDNLWIASMGNNIMKYEFNSQRMVIDKALPSEYVLNIVQNKYYDLVHYPQRLISVKTKKTISNVPFFGLEYVPTVNKAYLISTGIDSCEIFEIDTANNITKTGIGEILPKKLARITDFMVFAKNDQWLLTYDGMYHIDHSGNKPKLIGHYLKGNAVSWIIKDHENNYWVSTLKNGIFMIPALTVWHAHKNNSLLPDNRVTELTRGDNKTLYLGTGQGSIAVFDMATNQIKRILKVDATRKDFEAMEYDQPNHTLYAQTANLFQINTATEKITKSDNRFSAIKDLSVDWYGNILLCNTTGGLFVLKNESGKKSPFYNFHAFQSYQDYSIAYLRQQRSVTCLINKFDTTLWIGYTDGLFYYKKGKLFEAKDNKTQTPIFATKIVQDKLGVMWVGTVQNGVYGIVNGKVIAHFTQDDGLASNFIRCLAAEGNTLWLATDKGVQGLHTKSKAITTIGRNNGLVTTDVLDIHVENPYIYLATSKGFQWIHSPSLKKNLIRPYIYINHVKINERDTLLLKQYNLNSRQNNITVAFTGLAPRARNDIQYIYRMKGLDSIWSLVPASQNEIRFNALAPGDYVFEVKSMNEDQVYSISSATVSFFIDAPYWQKWWFIVLIALLLIGIVSFLFMLRINIIRKRNTLEKKNVKLELEKNIIEKDLRTSQLAALKVQMNPHFIFNALNSIQEYILTNEKKLANSFLGKFSDLMRLYLDMSNKKSVSLGEEIKAMKLYLELEAMRFEDSFEFNLHVDENLHTDEIQIPPMIIQPYVENAIKHGLLHKRTERKLSVRFLSGLNGALICEVIDNGIGRKQSQELNKIRTKKHTSFATGATQKRLELLNYGLERNIGVTYHDLYDIHGNANGTKVVITI